MHLKDVGDRIQAALNSVDSHFLLYFRAAPRMESCTRGLLRPRSLMPVVRLLGLWAESGTSMPMPSSVLALLRAASFPHVPRSAWLCLTVILQRFIFIQRE